MEANSCIATQRSGERRLGTSSTAPLRIGIVGSPSTNDSMPIAAQAWLRPWPEDRADSLVRRGSRRGKRSGQGSGRMSTTSVSTYTPPSRQRSASLSTSVRWEYQYGPFSHSASRRSHGAAGVPRSSSAAS